jgi:hypothetical protein
MPAPGRAGSGHAITVPRAGGTAQGTAGHQAKVVSSQQQDYISFLKKIACYISYQTTQDRWMGHKAYIFFFF